MPRRPQQTSRRRIQAALRESEFLTLRLAGHSYHAIARRAGAKSTGHVFRVVKTALVRAATLSTASAAQLRLIELDRLDIAIDTLLPRVLKGDDDAISLYLKALKRRADLLGLNAPVKVVGPDGGPVQLQPVPAAPMDAEPQRLLGTAALQAALDAPPDEPLEQPLALSARA